MHDKRNRMMQNRDEIIDGYLIEEFVPELTPAERAKQKKASQKFFMVLRDIFVAFIIIMVILQFVKPTVVFEHSMESTLHPEDYVLLERQAYRFNEVAFGDIVVCSSELMDSQGERKNLIKRVIGVPGDTVEIKDEAIWRNGERLFEPYTRDGYTEGQMDLAVVPEGYYFLVGDNRQVSIDSRNPRVGMVDAAEIMGKVNFRLFPFSDMGKVSL